jgi:pimeloyl-ACP methyl ester carboxylesterase
VRKDGIVLLHGIFRTHRSMGRLARFLERNGFAVLNLGYPSTKYPIEMLVDIVHPRIENFTESITGQLHFVSYSMGGLLMRAYLCKYRPSHLGRVVMIGTPNKGSEVADFLKSMKLYRWLYGPAGQQLITDQAAFAHCLGKVDYELGVIAGNRPIDPISSRIIGKPNDGKVSIDSTMLEGMKDHIVIPSSHTFFPSNKATWHQVLLFFRNGEFSRQ